MSSGHHAADRRRRALFPVLAVLFALLLLLLAEAVLRLSSVGDDYPLFVDVEQAPGWRQANPDVIQRYFATAPELRIAAIPFDASKAPDTLRIVVQGGSTAAGFPYGRWAGLAGMLGDRLETSFPDRRIEVISTAMAAVNSYTLLDFADEIIEIEPDAVLIYAGHNEFLGVMGAGSALTPSRLRSATLLHLELRRLRLYQLIQWGIGLAKAAVSGATTGSTPTDAPARTLMARAASSAHIAFGSETYERGLLQFERNLGRILHTYEQAGIPVYLGTLASNEGDLPPFAGESANSDSGQTESLWQAYRQARGAEDLPATRAALASLLAIDDAGADAWYALGSLEREEGNLPAARTAYRNARDRDQLPFRAPEAFNWLIRQLASRHGATLVDVEASLAAASPDGIIGNDLLLEHVHPNARGYFLLADAYFEALKARGVLADGPGVPNRAQAAADMPITAIDRLLAAHAVRELRAAFPFVEASESPGVVPYPRPTNAIERLAARHHADELDWLDAMEGLLQLHRRSGRRREAIVVARMAAQAYPADSAPNFSAGMLYLEARQFRRARRYLERSLAAAPDDVPTLKALIRTNLALADGPTARAQLEQLERIAPGDPLLRRAGAPLPGEPGGTRQGSPH